MNYGETIGNQEIVIKNCVFSRLRQNMKTLLQGEPLITIMYGNVLINATNTYFSLNQLSISFNIFFIFK